MSRWVRVARLDELEEGVVYQLVVDAVRLAVVRNGSEVHAVGDRCSHLGVSLSKGGPATAGRLSCWLHGSRFDLRSGRPLEPPATAALPVHEVVVEGDAEGDAEGGAEGDAIVLVDLEPRLPGSR